MIRLMSESFSFNAITTRADRHPGEQALRGLLFVCLFLWASLLTGCATRDTPRILFLGWDDEGVEQLFVTRAGQEPEQQTTFVEGVLDYAPGLNGEKVILSVPDGEGGTDLWLQDGFGSEPEVVYNCVQAECVNFEWAADGRRVLFVKRALDENGHALTPDLWWLDVESGEAVTVLADAEAHAGAGRLSADETWLSYVSPEDEGVYLYNFEDGRRQFITNEIGTPVSWSPAGEELVVPRFELVIVHGDEGEDHLAHSHNYQTAVHLLYMNLITGESRSISGDLSVEDSVPAWSPDGEWIAFGRRVPRTNSPRQLWIMRKDGSEARVVAGEAGVTYGPPQWTGDGRALIFQRFVQDEAGSEPAIWQLDLQTGEMMELAPEGMQPRVLNP
jgi:TolB protein